MSQNSPFHEVLRPQRQTNEPVEEYEATSNVNSGFFNKEKDGKSRANSKRLTPQNSTHAKPATSTQLSPTVVPIAIQNSHFSNSSFNNFTSELSLNIAEPFGLGITGNPMIPPSRTVSQLNRPTPSMTLLSNLERTHSTFDRNEEEEEHHASGWVDNEYSKQDNSSSNSSSNNKINNEKKNKDDDHDHGMNPDGKDNIDESGAKKHNGKEARDMITAINMFRYATTTEVWLMILGLIMAVLGGASMPCFSFVFGRLLKDLNSLENVKKATTQTAKIMVYIGVGICVVTLIHTVCWLVTASRQVGRIRSRFFRACLRQDIGWHDEHSPGELTLRMTGDTVVIQNGIDNTVALGVRCVSMGVLGFVFGFAYCWELTLLMLGMMPILALVIVALSSAMMKLAEQSRKDYSDAGFIATEVMENVRTVQTFGKEGYEVDRFTHAIDSARGLGVKKQFVKSSITGVIMALVYINYCIAFFFGEYLILWERSSFDKIVATFLATLIGCIGLGATSPSISAFNEARIVAYEIYKVIDRVPAIDIEITKGKI